MPNPSRVLLVDDREAVRESLQLYLDGFDCDFAEAGTGAAASELVRTRTFDVTFLAVKLPDMEGMEFLRQMREKRPVLGKVVVVTSLPDPKREKEAKEFGAFRYIEKPLDIEQVRAIFAEATSTSAAPPPPPPDIEPDPMFTAPTPPPPFRHILILDDHPERLDQVRESLERDFELIPTMDADEACTWANQEEIDLVVIYHKLARGISCFSVLSRMRMAHPDLRAIVLIDYPDRKPRFDPKSALAYAWRKDLQLLPAMIRDFLDQPLGRKKVFLSYAKEDRKQVLEIFEELTSHGYLPWMDTKSITPGIEWEQELPAAIDASHFFVYCLSRHSATKAGTLLGELKFALDKQRAEGKRFIITACLEENIPLEPPLKAYQAIDLLGHGISPLLDALSVTDAPRMTSPSNNSRQERSGADTKTLAEIIAGGESEEVEFKSTVRWDLIQKKANKDLEMAIVKTVSAFLNSYRGGTLLIGVGDDGTPIGLENDYQTLKKKNRDGFQAFVYELLLDKYGQDVAPLFHLEFEKLNNKDICRVIVQPSHKPVYVAGSLYMRAGNATHALSPRDAIEYSRVRWK